jgi:hypothetical protein
LLLLWYAVLLLVSEEVDGIPLLASMLPLLMFEMLLLLLVLVLLLLNPGLRSTMKSLEAIDELLIVLTF